MKKTLLSLTLAVFLFSSCATIFGGQITECQRTRPAPGEPARQVRVAALIFDIVLFWPATVVDFATNAIYRPCAAPMHAPPESGGSH